MNVQRYSDDFGGYLYLAGLKLPDYMPFQQALLIVIGGPTGVGKTAFALRLAQQTGASILSADSRQVFKEMPIGSAAPSAKELAQVRHYFIGDRSISEPFNAGIFADEARQLLKNSLFPKNPVQIVCGGSGLYLHALLHGLDQMPDVPPEIREQIGQLYQNGGIQALQNALSMEDPEHLKKIDPQNPQRLMRALELIRASGMKIAEIHRQTGAALPYRIAFLALDLPREQLYGQINSRAIKMIETGWIDEARELLPYRSRNALQTVGYKELFEHFDGIRNLNETIRLIQQNTRRFAKRQLTWLRNKEKVHWIHPDTPLERIMQQITRGEI